METELLKNAIETAAKAPDQLTQAHIEALRGAAERYPATSLPAALVLRYGPADLPAGERDRLRTQVALMSSDPRAAIDLVDPAGDCFGSFYPPEPKPEPITTEDAIDTFLRTYGHQSPEEDALLEQLIFNPAPRDFSAILARQEPVEAAAAEAAPVPEHAEADRGPSATSQEALIDAFLDAFPATPAEDAPAPVPHPAPRRPEPPAEPLPHAESSTLSESLAKIYIKQGRYERAFEIITNLSLKYPKKSIYFADQLRFLQKLIINQRFAERNNS